MNKLRCLLSGGHRFAPDKIVTCKNPINFTYELKNFCVKCGKPISFEIPDSFIDKEIEKFRLREWQRWMKK